MRIAVGVLVAASLGAGFAVRARAQGPIATPTAPPAAAAPSSTVKITIITVPPQKRVFVYWGKKRLGVIAPKAPLILQRPRDSGPLDLIIQCEGFVSVQTRAYTFGDTKLAVKLTPLDQKSTILGYRQEVPPPAAAPDGGVPAPSVAPALPPGVAAPPPGVAAPRPGVAAPPPGVAAPRPDSGAR
jgi:hypothetical protein